MNWTHPVRNWVGILLLAGVAWLVYSPGLRGGFLFDDFVNLDALGATGPVDDWPTFWRYITSGTADPIGRPLSLLSFLIDARDWPADAAPFLRTNILLHIANGVLLFVLLRQLQHRLSNGSSRGALVASAAAGLWMLHPLFVSTTLYIVQREAMLPATFTLLGLIAWCHGRSATPGARATAWMAGGLLGFGTLALLSKANGVLLPVLALVLDWTVFRHRPGDHDVDRAARWLRLWLLVVPSTLVLAYLATRLPHVFEVPSGRDWTIGQRLLTEPRILLDYLRLLCVPSASSSGLYNDGYVVSRSLLMPWTTLPAILLLLATGFGAFHWRRRFPRLSAAILFFLAGHLLESTIIPLELYFEHRNYLPAMLVFWPLAHVLLRDGAPRWGVAASAALVVLFAFTTWQRAVLWGQPAVQASLWAQTNPQSSRAQATVAMHLVTTGRAAAARARLDPLWHAAPNDLQLAFNFVDASCRTGGLSTGDAQRVELALATASRASGMVARWMEGAMESAASGTCPGLDTGTLSRWIQAAERNPAFSPDVAGPLLASLRAQLALQVGDAQAASRHFHHVLRQSPNPDTAARNTAMLASAGHYRLALAQLDAFEQLSPTVEPSRHGMPALHMWVLRRQGYWEQELTGLRRKLAVEIAGEDTAR